MYGQDMEEMLKQGDRLQQYDDTLAEFRGELTEGMRMVCRHYAKYNIHNHEVYPCETDSLQSAIDLTKVDDLLHLYVIQNEKDPTTGLVIDGERGAASQSNEYAYSSAGATVIRLIFLLYSAENTPAYDRIVARLERVVSDISYSAFASAMSNIRLRHLTDILRALHREEDEDFMEVYNHYIFTVEL